MTAMTMIRVFLADDHPVVRAGMRTLLGEAPDIRVTAEAHDGHEVLRALADPSFEIDVLVLDLVMKGLSGFEVLRRARVIRPALAILILSMYPEEPYAEQVLSLAVSPNGANASVMFTNGSSNRVRSAFMSTAATKPGSVQVASSSAAAMPKPSTFVYLDDTTLLYSQLDSSVSPAVIHNVTLVTPPQATPAGTATGTPTDVPALQDLYDVRPNAGNFWAWKDAYSGTTWTSTTLFSVDAGALTATTTGTTRADGATTYSYVPVANTPPLLIPVQNKAAAHPYFATSASLVAYKKRAAYSSYNLYETDPLGGAYVAGTAAETDRGLLSYYYDGMTTYAPIGSTSGANVFAIGSRWYNGYAQLPGRTYLLKSTWFRWTFPGDYFTEAAAPITRQIKVTPLVAARKAVSGRYTTLYGTATRAGGTAVMQRLTSRGWRTVTSVAMVKKSNYLSTYNFGRRVLPKAAYRIVTVADRGWALGVSAAFRL